MNKYLKQINFSFTLFITFLYVSFTSCSSKEHVDLIVHNAVVYRVDHTFSQAQSFAVKDGKFIAVGSNKDILKEFDATEIIDANGKAIYPGFIDSHCHFYSYGMGLQEVDLVGTKSFEEVIERVKKVKAGTEWIIGRGWDQNDWIVKEYPNKKILDSIFPCTPVILTRVDGHAALANEKALQLAKINLITKINGGLIEIKNNKLTGILIDNAVDLVSKEIPKPSKEIIKTALQAAEKNCFAVGLTTVDDAGLDKNVVEIIAEMQKNAELKMKVYAMLSDSKENITYYIKTGIHSTDRLNVQSFKYYADGALGSRGACLLKPYSDKPEQSGFLLNNKKHFIDAAIMMADKGWQMNTHCIGDSAVRMIMQIYIAAAKEIQLKDSVKKTGFKNLRWRIEHFQVTTADDIALLAKVATDNNIIPSVQPTHATSDMYWAKDRLGAERVKYAYAYNDLLKAAGMIALGTDFPVENINPLFTFYAAVARKDLKGFPEGGFQMENALSRENTLRGMTIWGAFANAEEGIKGSIEVGKFADFIILDADIMKCDIDKTPHVKVLYTFVNGENVYSLKK